MNGFVIPKEKTAIALNSKRDVKLTMPWFSQTSRHPPRAATVLQPLINGERAFAAVHEAIAGAKHSIDLIAWGFDPSMRLKRPGGERVGDLLKRQAAAGVQVRMLVWKSALANLGENNIIGDGLGGSGGGSAGAGSGIGRTGAGNAAGTSKNGLNGYGSAKTGSGSAGVMADDPDASAFNRNWFANHTKNLSFRTRDFGSVDKSVIAVHNIDERGLGGIKQHIALVNFPSHHQKTLVVDYEHPDDAVGFVMGHNMLRDYWDTDAHEYDSELRLGFQPWQDLSSRIYGAVLWDLNENFCSAWARAQPWIGSDMPIDANRAHVKPEAFEASAAKHGAPEMAQICRTQSQESDRSILEAYQLALSNARNYVYFENQYFRHAELAMLMRQVRTKLKAGGWKRDFYVFVVTNVPPDSGRITTYETLRALGKAESMPEIDKKNDGAESHGDSAALRSKDLDGLNVHVCTLAAYGGRYVPGSAVATGGAGPMGLPGMAVAMPSYTPDYLPIYVHSKLLLVDDVYFTLGSANVNVRSMEVDSELNIAMTSPAITQQWRKHLWGLHTGRGAKDDPAKEFDDWQKIMMANESAKRDGKPLTSHLLEFYDDAKTGSRAD